VFSLSLVKWPLQARVRGIVSNREAIVQVCWQMNGTREIAYFGNSIWCGPGNGAHWVNMPIQQATKQELQVVI